MMRTTKKTQLGYPYRILAFDRTVAKKPLPVWVNEFLMIEAVLRSPKTMKAYRQALAKGGRKDARQALIEELKRYGIRGHDPMNKTHHALLTTVPLPDVVWKEKMAQLGRGSSHCGILDLGVIAKLPPNATVTHEQVTVHGPTNGEADCLAYLRSPDPRFMCVRLDKAYPPSVIVGELRRLLAEEHPRFKHARFTGLFGKTHRTAQRRFRNIPTWLRYLKCYDLQMSGSSIDEIATQVWADSRDPINLTNKALQAVRRLIKTVENTGCLPDRL
jgi:hypothetical protein